ncbi:MAG: uroporphyrinogen-III synthase, partial [Veillonella sp.]|nr:uroporphyrinogen-III synthase [Veillonella sp.]
FDTKPLFGKRIVTTRAKGKSAAFASRLQDLGAEVIACAAIKTQALDLNPDGEAMLANLDDYACLAFTSAQGVRYFFEALHERHKDARALGQLQVCAVGTATAKALESYGIMADFIPMNYKAESLAETLLAELKAGDKLLLVQPKVARHVIQDTLQAQGLSVDTLRLYETLIDQSQGEFLREALEQGVDYVTFTSGSTVKNTLALLGESAKDLLGQAKLACIGPITAATLVEQGLEPGLISSVYTMDGLVEAILEDNNQ